MKRLLLILLCVSNLIPAQGYLEIQKITANDPGLAAQFGYDVAIQGDFAVIGAKHNPLESNSMGSTYIFKKDGNGVWSEYQKLIAPDRRQFDSFGHSVAIDGNYIVVSAIVNGYDVSNNNFLLAAGAVYIFKKDTDDNWNFHQKITALDRTTIAYFGYSVDISGDRIIIGAGRDDYDVNGDNFLDEAGAAYFFEKGTNDVWNQVAKVTAPIRNTQDRFGYAVSIYGDYASVGAYLEDEDENEANTVISTGSVYVYKRNTNSTWDFQQKLVASVRPTTGESLGWSLDMDVEYIVAGAFQADDPGSSAGAAYVFKRNTNDVWSQVDKLIALDGIQGEWFAYDVAIQGGRILVGTYQDYLIIDSIQNTHGSLYYFLKDTGLDTWSFQQKVLASNWQDLETHNFGISVDLDGNDAVVGDWVSDEIDSNTDEGIVGAGSAFLLEFDENLTLSTQSVVDRSIVKVYPNPTKDKITIDLSRIYSKVYISIYNSLGQQIAIQEHKFLHKLTLDLNLANGIYFLKISSEEGVEKTFKIIKQS